MVGEDISTDARGKVNSEMTCKQERVLGSADGTPLTQLVSQKGIIGSSIESGWSGCIGTMHQILVPELVREED